jgi:hypothetical protein
VTIHREFGEGHRQHFVSRGFRSPDFFSHRTYTIPKCGPDAFKAAKRMVGDGRAESYWLLTLHADPLLADEFPEALFYDDDLIRHRQQFGQPGHVAFAIFVRVDDDIYGLAYVSDLVQRQTRADGYRAQVWTRFRGWRHMLLNSLVHFAMENGVRTIHSPTAATAMRHADPKRTVQPELFERVYDKSLTDYYDVVHRGKWWVIDVARNRDRIVVPDRVENRRARRPSLCITHDIERGLGHRTVDPDFADRADAAADGHLDDILAAERRAGIRTTYNVVGLLYNDVGERISRDGHAIAFHSFNHVEGEDRQLSRCRGVDYRTRGYRVPRSKMTPELSREALLHYGFDWIASSNSSLGIDKPVIRGNVAYIPVLYDDFPLYRGDLSYDEWERVMLDKVEDMDFAAIGLHDCYAAHWLPAYDSLLERLSTMRETTTLDRVADELFLDSSV